jgi:sterol desaturase/sphingolipid hydroxylase (fatty acid hydroxylase superfamily)
MASSSLRLILFFSILFLFAFLEVFVPYRKRNLKRKDRWVSNFFLIAIANLLVKVSIPVGLITLADLFKEKGFGLFNIFEVNVYASILISIVLLDFLIYLQHIIAHKVSFLWKFHRVHHTDVDLDVTSALRFHPVEILFSIFYKLFFIFIFGIRPESVLVFEMILSSMAMFNHSNLHLPDRFESILRLLFVTPQMHIMHHSVKRHESDKNFGFNFSVWDRLFKTYIKDFEDSDKIGQNYFRKKEDQSLKNLLIQPFLKIK